MRTEAAGTRRHRRAIGTLAPAETRVLRLLARGLSNKEIARRLTVSVPTVKTHVHNLLHKLGTRRRADAGRLLHVAASEATVESRPARHLGVVGRTSGPEPGDRPQHIRAPAG